MQEQCQNYTTRELLASCTHKFEAGMATTRENEGTESRENTTAQRRDARTFSWSILSISLATFVVAVSCVLAIPLFPTKRTANHSQIYVQIFANICAIVCIIAISRPGRNLKQGLSFACWKINSWVSCCTQSDELAPSVNSFKSYNYLAKAFFLVCICTELWNLVKNLYFFAIQLENCAKPTVLVQNLSQIVLASFLFITIISKPSDRLQRYPKVSLLLWAFVCAVCLGAAFNYFIEEAKWGYLEIVELSIEHPEYGLNFTKCSSVAACVDPVFKTTAECIEHEPWQWWSHFLRECIPISAEFFALATFFCVIEWQRVGHPSKQQTEQSVETEEESARDFHVCGPDCRFSIRGRTAIGLCIVLLSVTIVEIVVFLTVIEYSTMNTIGVWIFIGHLVIGQAILLVTEAFYYHGHLRRMKTSASPPAHEQLNIMLLLLPLLPLGILYTLQIFPRLALTAYDEYTDAVSIRWTLINITKAILHLVQVAFQSMFIAEVFCTRDSRSYRVSRYFFLVLAFVNFCIWLGWSFMCKKVSVMGRSSKAYGEVAWVIIVYCTVPFALFGYAHASACCFEIFAEISNRKSASNSRSCSPKVVLEQGAPALDLSTTVNSEEDSFLLVGSIASIKSEITNE